MKIKLFATFVVIIFSFLNINVTADSYQSTFDYEDTVEVLYDEYDSYEIVAEERKVEIKVTVLSGGKVDFYILSDFQYIDYEEYYQGFERASQRENKSSYSYSGMKVRFYFIVDNTARSITGAIPKDNVTYKIKIYHSSIMPWDDIYGFFNSGVGVCCSIILIGIIITTWLLTIPKKYKERVEKYKQFKL